MQDVAIQHQNPEGLKLTWDHVNVSVTLPSPSLIQRIIKRKKGYPHSKVILSNVSGAAYSNSMLAIMGESGSGKSTLLNVLYGQKTKKFTVSSDIKLNGKVVDIRSISAYVEQNDIFIHTLTVYEHLFFNANLVLSEDMSLSDVHNRVNEIIHALALDSCRDTRIGSSEKPGGISGGQRKRLAIAAQLLSNPRIIFLDEPTSGLDSSTAETVIKTLKQISLRNCAIIATIHQPSSQIFNLFDRLLLMTEGVVIYAGPLKECCPFFSRAGFDCPAVFNPADFFIDKIAIKPGTEIERNEVIKKLLHAKTQFDEQNAAAIQNENINQLMLPTIVKRKKASTRVQFNSLLTRSWRSTVREPMLFKMRIFQIILISLIFGLIYLRLKDTTDNIYNFAGAIFAMISNISFGSLMGVIFIIPAELRIFRREHQKRLYSTWVYFLTKTLVDIPVFVLMPTIMLLINFFMIGFHATVENFFSFWIILTLISLCSTSYGYFISALASSFETASTLSTPLMIPLMIFGGFFVRTLNIPVYFIWIRYISWFSYGFDAMVGSQFVDINLSVDGPQGLILSNITSVDGSYAIKLLGIDDYGIVINTVALLCLTLGFRVLALVSLIIKTYRREH